MILPEQFDKNEWFVIIFLIVSYTILFLLPKRFPLSITILVMMFSVTIARLLDHLLAAGSFNAYDIMDTGKYDLFDFFVYLLYAPFGYFFVYFFDKYNIQGIGILIYIISGSMVGMLFEGLNVKFDVFSYKGWKLYYSFTVYIVVQYITVLLFGYIKNIHKLLQKT